MIKDKAYLYAATSYIIGLFIHITLMAYKKGIDLNLIYTWFGLALFFYMTVSQHPDAKKLRKMTKSDMLLMGYAATTVFVLEPLFAIKEWKDKDLNDFTIVLVILVSFYSCFATFYWWRHRKIWADER